MTKDELIAEVLLLKTRNPREYAIGAKFGSLLQEYINDSEIDRAWVSVIEPTFKGTIYEKQPRTKGKDR